MAYFEGSKYSLSHGGIAYELKTKGIDPSSAR